MADSIFGKYFISAPLLVSYELTDADRQANFKITQTAPGYDEKLDPICFNSPSLNGHVLFNVEADIKILRARIVPSGAFGVHASPQQIAGKFYLEAVVENTDDGSFDAFDAIALKFNDWGEWVESGALLKPYKRANTHDNNRNATLVNLGANTLNSKFYVDDYNIQSAYKGENMYPVLEMEIETAGLWDTDDHVIF